VYLDGLPTITICHGSPRKANEKLLSNSEKTFEIIKNSYNAYILCGHTHVQGKIEYDGKVVLNAGAVGVSLYGNGKAQFMILKSVNNEWEHEFISLQYDVNQVIEDLHSSGLSEKAPVWCRVSEHLLRTGTISHGTVLARAMALCEEMYGMCSWPKIPEECWERAAEEMLKD